MIEETMMKELSAMGTRVSALTRRVDALEQKIEELRVADDKGEPSLSDPSYGLSRRALNVLDRIGCTTLSELRRYGTGRLRNVRGCGNGTYNELLNLLT